MKKKSAKTVMTESRPKKDAKPKKDKKPKSANALRGRYGEKF